jgi:hypothetical protein
MRSAFRARERERIKEWADDSKSTHAIDHGCFVRVKPEDDISDSSFGHDAETAYYSLASNIML